MDAPGCAYVVHSSRPIREALTSVWKTATAAGWVVLGDYDLSGLLQPGSEIAELKSLDICRPEFARPIVAAEALSALLMPCAIVFTSTATGTSIATLRARVVLPEVFPVAARAIGARVDLIDAELRQILDAAC